MGPLSETLEPDTLGAGLSPQNEHTAASPDLALSLPASRNFEPRDMASLREAVFPSQAALLGKALPQRPSRRRVAEGIEQPSRQDNLRARLEGNQPSQGFGNNPAAVQAEAGMKTQGSHGTWVTLTSALQPPQNPQLSS